MGRTFAAPTDETPDLVFESLGFGVNGTIGFIANKARESQMLRLAPRITAVKDTLY